MRTLTKKTLRGMWKGRGQAAAVIVVMLCGTSCYICLASLHRNLLLTRDTYYAENKFADFEIMLERAPTTALYAIGEIPGVRQVRSRIVEEVKVDIEGIEETRSGRVISMPSQDTPVINDVVIEAGRYFDSGALDEVIVNEAFAEANGIELRDNIEITMDGKRHTLRVVGLGLSPEYVYVIRNIQELFPNPERFGILWVPEAFAETALSMQAACNNIVGTIDDPELVDGILERAEDLLDSYGVFSKVAKENQISNRFISDEIEGLETSAKIVPTVFLGIAALVIMILLNRMVRNERTQIGLMKAYGYSSWAIAAHYLQYALILSVAGCIGGFVLGQFLAGQMIKIYVQYYQFPILESRVYPDVLASAMGIAVTFALLGATVAAWRGARIQPADAMRPESPHIGQRVLLERITFVWQRMSFTWKMIARNVSRSKFRSALNAIGVMISYGLLLMGFYAMDGIGYMLDFQYKLTQREDVKLSFIGERGQDALYEAARLEHVRKAEPVLQYPFKVRNGWRKKDILIIGLERGSELQRLIDTDKNPVDIGERGLVLSDRLARDLAVSVGDIVTLEPLMGRITGERQVPITKIVDQYFGASGYMNIDALSRVLGEAKIMNAVLLRTDPGTEDMVSQAVKDVPGVAAVEIKKDALASMEATLAQSMSIMSGAVILFAAVISFAVIYNVTLVSLGERARELASLRVLGFSPQEVGRILYYENFVTGTIGLILGLPFGIGICQAMVKSTDTELYRLPFYIAPKSYVIAAAATMSFVAVANFAVRHKIYRLNMVEVLKARE